MQTLLNAHFPCKCLKNETFLGGFQTLYILAIKIFLPQSLFFDVSDGMDGPDIIRSVL